MPIFWKNHAELFIKSSGAFFTIMSMIFSEAHNEIVRGCAAAENRVVKRMEQLRTLPLKQYSTERFPTACIFEEFVIPLFGRRLSVRKQLCREAFSLERTGGFHAH